MKSTMKYALTLAMMTALSSPALAAQDCEVITLKPDSATIEDARFHDGTDFIESLYDAEPARLSEIDGAPIVAVMCRRDDLLPTMRDLPIIQTGLPFSLSQDFDSANSGLLTVYDDGTAYRADYVGDAALGPDKAALDNVVEIFNFQRLAQQ